MSRYFVLIEDEIDSSLGFYEMYDRPLGDPFLSLYILEEEGYK
jgi:hypothetical protein